MSTPANGPMVQMQQAGTQTSGVCMWRAGVISHQHMDQQTAGRHTVTRNTTAPPHVHSTPEYNQNVLVHIELPLSGKGVCVGNLKKPGSEHSYVNVDVWDETYRELIPEWLLEIFRSTVTFVS